jgi:alpha-beta hydrolase superfamily lysophospholipase
VTGRGLGIRPSDNIEMLRALGRDPLVIKETRIDTVYGLVNLMDSALADAARLDDESLILIGANDQVIPPAPTRIMLEELPEPPPRPRTVAVYTKGFHMLLRDLQRKNVWRDIVAWIANPKAALPSGANRNLQKFLVRETP